MNTCTHFYYTMNNSKNFRATKKHNFKLYTKFIATTHLRHIELQRFQKRSADS